PNGESILPGTKNATRQGGGGGERSRASVTAHPLSRRVSRTGSWAGIRACPSSGGLTVAGLRRIHTGFPRSFSRATTARPHERLQLWMSIMVIPQNGRAVNQRVARHPWPGRVLAGRAPVEAWRGCSGGAGRRRLPCQELAHGRVLAQPDSAAV